MANLARSTTLYKHQVTESSVEKPDFDMNPPDTIEASTAKPGFTDKLPARTFT